MHVFVSWVIKMSVTIFNQLFGKLAFRVLKCPSTCKILANGQMKKTALIGLIKKTTKALFYLDTLINLAKKEGKLKTMTMFKFFALLSEPH